MHVWRYGGTRFEEFDADASDSEIVLRLFRRCEVRLSVPWPAEKFLLGWGFKTHQLHHKNTYEKIEKNMYIYLPFRETTLLALLKSEVLHREWHAKTDSIPSFQSTRNLYKITASSTLLTFVCRLVYPRGVTLDKLSSSFSLLHIKHLTFGELMLIISIYESFTMYIFNTSLPV